MALAKYYEEILEKNDECMMMKQANEVRPVSYSHGGSTEGGCFRRVFRLEKGRYVRIA